MPKVLPALLISLVSQTIGLAGLLMTINFFVAAAGEEKDVASLTPFITGLIVAGTSAFTCARLLGLSRPWQLANLLLPATLAVSLILNLPQWVFVLLILAPALLYLPALFAQVPYFPTSSPVVEHLLQILPQDRLFTFIDLGCGFGEPIFSLARHRPLGTFIGIDLSPLSISLAWLRSLARRNVTVRPANLWSYQVSEGDFIYAFLAPPPMERLGEKLTHEMKPEALLISNSFPIPDRSAIRSVPTGDQRQHTLFIYGLKELKG